MRKIEFTPIRLTEYAEIFSIRIENDTLSEFQKFLIMFRDFDDEYVKNDFNRIVEAISIIAEQGALERFFRNEGKYKDRVYAIPLNIVKRNHSLHGTLRLYCIRVSDKILIIGGGGIKTTRKYEDDVILLNAVRTLQAVEKELDGFTTGDTLLNLTIYID